MIGAEALATAAGTGIKGIGKAVGNAVDEAIPDALTGNKTELASKPAAAPYAIIIDGGKEVDLSGFEYRREYANSGFLVSNNGAVCEVYHVEFTGENHGNYTYESRLIDGSVIGSGKGTFRFKDK